MFSCKFLVKSVSIKPGPIAFTWMLWRTQSIARHLVNMMIAPFVVQ